MNTPYTLRLAPGELLWLMSAFGHSLPACLAGQFSSINTRDTLLAGAASLQQRDLIRPASEGPAWQVEGLLAALVGLIANPERCISMQRHLPTGPAARMFALQHTGLAAMLEPLPDGSIEITLFPALQDLAVGWAARLDLPARSVGVKVPAAFPQPIAFIRLAWQQPEQARHVLAAYPQALQWVAGLEEWLEFSCEDQALLLARAGKTWWSTILEPNALASWQEITSHDLYAWMAGQSGI